MFQFQNSFRTSDGDPEGGGENARGILFGVGHEKLEQVVLLVLGQGDCVLEEGIQWEGLLKNEPKCESTHYSIGAQVIRLGEVLGFGSSFDGIVFLVLLQEQSEFGLGGDTVPSPVFILGSSFFRLRLFGESLGGTRDVALR